MAKTPHDRELSTLIMSSPGTYQSGHFAKPRENGSVTSPTQSSAISLSDSFVSESPSLTFGLSDVIKGRSNTYDSFRSGSSSALDTPTNSEIIPLREGPKPRRPMSETRENFLDPPISPEADSCMTSSPASSSNIAVVLSKKGIRHEILRREATLDNPPGSEQRELSFPIQRHSKSFPHLYGTTTSCVHHPISHNVPEGISRTTQQPTDTTTLSFDDEDNDGSLGFHHADNTKPSKLVKSSSFLKHFGKTDKTRK